MSTEFKREDRYIVIKRSDLANVPVNYRSALVEPMLSLLSHLPRRECLVVESDWPEYELTWAAIEARVTGKPSDDIPDFTPGNGNKAERRATALVAQLQADLTERDEEIDALRLDAERYRWLRSRDLETISQGGVFAGITPQNMILNEETLDQAVDAAMAKVAKAPERCSGCGTPGWTGACNKCIPY